MKTYRLARAVVSALCPQFAGKLISREFSLAVTPEGVSIEPGKVEDLRSELLAKFSDKTSFAPDLGATEEKAAVQAALFFATYGQWPEGYQEAERLAALEHSNVIRDVEVFATGTHNGDTYTEQDIDDMVAAYKALDFKPALKIGHTKDKVGSPAYGYVENLRRVGTKMLADFSSMHDSVLNAIRSRQYDRVSSEIYFNFKRGAQVFRRALKAVALLGAEVPAVAGLVPLHKVQFAADSGFDKEATLDASLAVHTDSIVAALSERVAGLTTLLKEHDDMKTSAQIKAELKALSEEIAKLKGKKDQASETKLAELAEKAEGLEKDLAAVEKNEATETENKALKTRLAKLEEDQRKRDVKDRVAALTVPAFKPVLEALFGFALEHAPETKVAVFTMKDGKEQKEEKTLAEIGDTMVGLINANATKLFNVTDDKSGRRTQPEGGGNGKESPAEEMDRLTKEYLVKHPELKNDYAAAMDQISKENPDLAKRYEDSQNPRGN